ncbi:hypothetical protein DEGR_06840 [Deinococcus grandis]|nr:hypothetical protein DEGR_06840 [Deinococcus grandis]
MRPALPALLLGTALLTLGAAPPPPPTPPPPAPPASSSRTPEGHRVAFDHVILEGMVPPGATLTVSGTPVPTGPDGLYISWFPLKPGVNDLRLIARTPRPPRPERPQHHPHPARHPHRPPHAAHHAHHHHPRQHHALPAHRTVGPRRGHPQDRQIPVRFQGSPGGRATARIAGLPAQPLREGPAGTYSGTLDVPPPPA